MKKLYGRCVFVVVVVFQLNHANSQHTACAQGTHIFQIIIIRIINFALNSLRTHAGFYCTNEIKATKKKRKM